MKCTPNWYVTIMTGLSLLAVVFSITVILWLSAGYHL